VSKLAVPVDVVSRPSIGEGRTPGTWTGSFERNCGDAAELPVPESPTLRLRKDIDIDQTVVGFAMVSEDGRVFFGWWKSSLAAGRNLSDTFARAKIYFCAERDLPSI
jgi:hypothetical protein